MRALALCVLVGAAGCTDFDALSRGYTDRDLSVSPAPPDLATFDEAPPEEHDLSNPNDLFGADLTVSCADGIAGPGETDVDCGGACGPCEVGRQCAVAADCKTGQCEAGRCELAYGPPYWLPVGAPATGNNAPIARYDLMLERGPDGSLYAMGGADATTDHLSDVEALAPDLTWSSPGSLQRKRGRAATCASATTVWVISGAKNTGLENSVERMTSPPNFNLAPGLTPSVVGAGAAVGGDARIYFAGGSDGNATLSTVRAFASGDTNLTNLKDLGTPRESHGVATGADGRIYAIGGVNGGSTLGTAEAYDIATNLWVPVASLPEPRTGSRAVLAPDGRIYLPGGADPSAGQVYASVVAYRSTDGVIADRWSHVAPLGSPRWRHGVAVGIDGRIYVVAGTSVGALQRAVEAYGPIVSVSPNHASAGGAVQVSGSNFAKNASVSLSLLGGTVVVTGTTDGQGVLPTTAFLVPAAAVAGPTRLVAVDDRSRYPVSQKITVDP
jgi:hypothetical protein